jgi:hypothetical protein
MKGFEPLIGEWHVEGEISDETSDEDRRGFNQRFFGEISADGKTIEGRWDRGMGDAGDEWEVDLLINYFRT